MTPHLGFATLLLASLMTMPIVSTSAHAQSAAPALHSDRQTPHAHSTPAAASTLRYETNAKKQHGVLIEVSENDPKTMTLALNNA